MVKQSTVKKPRAPRKKKILIDIETDALKIPAATVPMESDYTVVTLAPENTPQSTKIEPFIVNLNPTPQEFVPFSNDLSKYQIVNPDGSAYTLVNVTKGPDDFLYVGEAERVAREEAEAASKDGYFTPTRPVIKRYDFLPRERKKIILALVAGIFCLLGLIALATLAFFGEIGISS